MSMLDYMEYCGKVGMSRNVGIYADGDGSFRPKFKTNIKWEKQSPRLIPMGIDYMMLVNEIIKQGIA